MLCEMLNALPVTETGRKHYLSITLMSKVTVPHAHAHAHTPRDFCAGLLYTERAGPCRVENSEITQKLH